MNDKLASEFLAHQLSGKKEERWVVESILKRLGLNFLEIKGTEKPDFLVDFSETCRVSIELTQYFNDIAQKGSQQQTLLRNWTSFSKNLSQELKSRSLGNFYGALHFKSHNTEFFQRIDKEKLIEELVNLVERYQSMDEAIIMNFNDNPILNQNVACVYLSKVSSENEVLWWHASLQSGIIVDPTDTINIIVDIVKRKNNIYDSYDFQHANENWLVIFAHGNIIANELGPLFSSMDLHHEIKKLDIKFTRIIIWDKLFDSIVEIYPKHKTIFALPKLYIKNIPEILRNYEKPENEKIIIN